MGKSKWQLWFSSGPAYIRKSWPFSSFWRGNFNVYRKWPTATFEEAIETKKKQHINRYLAINRDPGDICLSWIYNNLILKDSMNIFTQSNFRKPVRIYNENRNCRRAKYVARQRILFNLIGNFSFIDFKLVFVVWFIVFFPLVQFT